MIDKIIIKKPVSGVYNVGYGRSFSIKQITDAISKILDKSIKLKSKNIIRKNEILDLFADIKKYLRHLIGNQNFQSMKA